MGCIDIRGLSNDIVFYAQTIHTPTQQMLQDYAVPELANFSIYHSSPNTYLSWATQSVQCIIVISCFCAIMTIMARCSVQSGETLVKRSGQNDHIYFGYKIASFMGTWDNNI